MIQKSSKFLYSCFSFVDDYWFDIVHADNVKNYRKIFIKQDLENFFIKTNFDKEISKIFGIICFLDYIKQKGYK